MQYIQYNVQCMGIHIGVAKNVDAHALYVGVAKKASFTKESIDAS